MCHLLVNSQSVNLESEYFIRFQKNPTSLEMLARTSKYLTPTRTHFISVELLNPFWLKNDGEKWSRKNYFKTKPAQKG